MDVISQRPCRNTAIFQYNGDRTQSRQNQPTGTEWLQDRPCSQQLQDKGASKSLEASSNDDENEEDLDGVIETILRDSPASTARFTAVKPIVPRPYTAVEEPGRTDPFYRRYLELSENVAYRYPDPGPPTFRQGSVGASWRHIKEVQGHNSRVLYVDGLVRLYDTDGVNRVTRPRRLTPNSAAMSTPVGACRNYAHDYAPSQSKQTTRMPPINSTTLMLPGAPAKYKGFYKYSDY